MFGIVAYFLSADDPIWGWLVFGLALAITGGYISMPEVKALEVK